MTNLQTNTSLTASQNLNPFEVVLVWTTKNKYSLPHFQYFVTKREKFSSSQMLNSDCEQLIALEHHQAAVGKFQDRSSSGFRREVESWQTLGWSYFNWEEKGKTHTWNTSELMSWKMQFKPAANKASPGKPQQCPTASSPQAWRKWVPKANPDTPHWPWTNTARASPLLALLSKQLLSKASHPTPSAKPSFTGKETQHSQSGQLRLPWKYENTKIKTLSAL